jgi:CDP-6-deoxy-D-xylo-4-hexulose-3-dehydrase
LGGGRLLPGDEVITVAAGFPTTVNPIIQNNLKPVFIDIDIGTYNINIKVPFIKIYIVFYCQKKN